MSSSERKDRAAASPAACGNEGGTRDKRRLVATKTPGVYKRVDGKGKTVGYVAVIEVAGKQRKRSAKTYEEARRIKRGTESDRDRGEVEPHRTTIKFLQFLDEWVERYRGQGRRGFRDNTRDEYRRLIKNYAHPFFSSRLKLVEVTTYGLSRFIDWLADEDEQGGRLSDKTIANILIPLRTALATAKREGLIRENPAHGLALPHRAELVGDGEEQIKVFSRKELALILSLSSGSRYGLLYEVLAGTGLRISEAVALQRLHFQLDDGPPEICVRRGCVKGRIEPPKSKHGRRDIRISRRLAAKMRERFADEGGGDPTALAFTNRAGGAINPDTLRQRNLKPLVEEAGASWAAFHTFRHTFASLHLAAGTNVVQLSRALGHHSAAFTLTRYAHLIPGEFAPPLDVAAAVVNAPDTVDPVFDQRVAA